jgi:hypothetical protein
MRVVQCLYVAAGPTTLESLAPARLLEDESPILCQKFRKALFESPKGFKYAVEMEGFPTVHLEWIPVGQTSGAILFPPFVTHPGRTGPDLLSLLVNGLESPSELSELARRFPIHAGSWQKMLIAEKPVAFNLLYTVGRLREPATITIINAFANSFFCMFGTNEAPAPL